MMGYNHSLSGMAAGSLVVPAVAPYTVGALTLHQKLFAILLCGGAALLPDWDHPQSTVARTLGPITSIPAVWIAKAAGGHRGRTHSIVFALFVAAVAVAASYTWWGMFTMFALFGSWCLRLFGPRDVKRAMFGAGPQIVAVGAAVLAAEHVEGGLWIGLCVLVGSVTHVLGDMLTTGRVPPILWPVTDRGFSLRLCKTGDSVEALLAILFAVGLVAGLWPTLVGSGVFAHNGFFPT